MEEQKQGKKSTAYKNQYITKAYDQLRICGKKDLEIPARIEKAVSAGQAPSKQAYMIQAILDKLDNDGY